jgi:peroxiredoxin
VDSIEKHLDFKNKYSLDFPLLSDRDAVVADKYGAKLQIPVLGKFANRYTYIINGSGKIEKVFTDVESKVRRFPKALGGFCMPATHRDAEPYYLSAPTNSPSGRKAQ